MQALLSEQQDDKTLTSVQTLDESRLPEGDITVDVRWLSLNYKGALATTGKGKAIRDSPMVPGVDFAGTVRTSKDPRFHVGQEVLLIGWGISESHWGGLAEQTRVEDDWLVTMPQGLSVRRAMIIGTAGFTAMLRVMALGDAGVHPQDGEIVVMGTGGGVDSTAVALLYKLGYQVVTVPGRKSTHEYLESLGTSHILSRGESTESHPLEKQVWAGAIDTVSDKVLAKVLTQVSYGGCVATCGLTDGFTLPTTVMPFTLCNIRLQGVDSVMTPLERCAQAWQRLIADLPESFHTRAAKEISLLEAPNFAKAIINN